MFAMFANVRAGGHAGPSRGFCLIGVGVSGSPDGREGLPQIAAAGYILRLVWLRLFGGGVRSGEDAMLHKTTFVKRISVGGSDGICAACEK